MPVILVGDKVIDGFNATVICLLPSKQKERLNFIERLVKRKIHFFPMQINGPLLRNLCLETA